MTFEKIRRVSNELTTVFIGSSGANKKVATTTGDTKVKDAKEVEKGVKPPEPIPVDQKAKWNDIIVKAGDILFDIDPDRADAWIKEGGK